MAIESHSQHTLSLEPCPIVSPKGNLLTVYTYDNGQTNPPIASKMLWDVYGRDHLVDGLLLSSFTEAKVFTKYARWY